MPCGNQALLATVTGNPYFLHLVWQQLSSLLLLLLSLSLWNLFPLTYAIALTNVLEKKSSI